MLNWHRICLKRRQILESRGASEMNTTHPTLNQRSNRSRSLLRPVLDLGRQGFTVVELVLVGLAASLVATATIPKLTTTVDRFAVTMARDEFVRAHQSARAVAINYGRTAVVRIDATAGRVWVEVDTTFAQTGERTTVGKVVDLSDSGVRLHATTTSLCFNSSGIAPRRGRCAGSGEFVFSKGNRTETVAISATGFVH